MSKAAELAKWGEVSTNGQVSGRRNMLINGAMQIWQRGTSFTAGNSYTTDRWLTDNAGSHTRSTDTPASFDYSLKLNPTSGNAVVRQAIELSAAGEGGVFQSGQQFTLSFWLKSSAGGEGINVFIASSTTVAGATTQMASAIGIATTTTGWVKYTYTYTQPSAVGSSDTCYNIVPYVVAPSGDIYITGLQFETGSVATPFEHRSYGEELALCHRYALMIKEGATSIDRFGLGSTVNTTQVQMLLQHPVSMRSAPTLTTTGTASNYGVYSAAVTACSVVPALAVGSQYNSRINFVVGSGLTAGQVSQCIAANTDAYLLLTSEL